MKQVKRIACFILCAVMMLSVIAISSEVSAAGIKLSKSSITLNKGKTTLLVLKKGKKKVSAKWK